MNLTVRQNTINRALSQYTNFFFDRGFCNVGGKTLALKCDALCELGSDTDNGTVISAKFQTGMADFGGGRKRIRSLHIKGHFTNRNAVTIKYAMDNLTPDLECVEASTSALGSGGSGALKFQGVRSRAGEYLEALIENVNGAFFKVQSLTTFLVTGSRR
ncbi:MAG: hypothetical protein U9N61_13135 [Euryarchaeota archaeon]|nr:hypothetical protein [Euryarchaeota archaeon]